VGLQLLEQHGDLHVIPLRLVSCRAEPGERTGRHYRLPRDLHLNLAGNLLDLLYQVTTGPAPPSWHRVFGTGGPLPGDWPEASSNRLTSVRNAGQPEVTLTYDDAGNLLTEADSRHFSWDHAGRVGRLPEHAGAGTSVSARCLYGADGRRVKKWVRRNNSTSLDESRRVVARPCGIVRLPSADGERGVVDDE
jgi:YD repeat-containing protein